MNNLPNMDPRALSLMQEQQRMAQTDQTLRVATICMNVSCNRDKFLADAESAYAQRIIDKADEILLKFLTDLTTQSA